MAVPTLADLLTRATKAAIYDLATTIGASLGLPVSTWHDGDPTDTEYWVLAEYLSALESNVIGYISAGFLDFAAAESGLYNWLVLQAYEVYGYEADEATYASGTVTLTNSGGASYSADDLAAGNLTFENSTTGKTYTNTNTGGETLASGPGITVDLTIAANEAGSDSSAAATEVDTLVTGLLGVTCSNAAALTGTDAETAQSIVTGCRNKLGSLSPNGPADAYDYVATKATLTTAPGVTRSRTYHDSATGDVTVYLAGPSGAVTAGEVTLVEAAITTYATPLCVTPTVSSATNLTQAVTYELWLYDSVGMTTAEVEEAVEDALAELFLGRPIGGDIKAAVGSGKIYRSMIKGTIKATFTGHFVDVDVTVPAADQAVTAGQVPVLGVVTATDVHLEEAPA